MEIHPSIRNLSMVIYIIIHRPTDFCYVGQTMQKLCARITQHLHAKSQFVDKIIRIEGKDKSVMCVNTGETFKSVTEATKKFGLVTSGVSSVCNGRLKTTGGLTFTFSDNPVKDQSFLVPKNIKPRQVLCLNTGEKFPSIHAASRNLGIDRNSISDVCSGKRRTAGD